MTAPDDVLHHVDEIVRQRDARQHGPERHPAEQNDEENAREVYAGLSVIGFIVEKVVAEEIDDGIDFSGCFRLEMRVSVAFRRGQLLDDAL